jgi:hypothetical protein
MNRLGYGIAIAVCSAALLLSARAGEAQSGFYKPYGATRSDAAPSSGAGYSYVAPSYQIGLTRTAYRGYADYYGLPRTPAYRSSGRVPYLSHIQPWYQTSYSPLYGNSVPPLGSPLSFPNSGHPGLGYVFSPQAYTVYRTGAIYRPYTTVSQFVYTPSYSPVTARPYPGMYGAYGFSVFYGY